MQIVKNPFFPAIINLLCCCKLKRRRLSNAIIEEVTNFELTEYKL